MKTRDREDEIERESERERGRKREIYARQNRLYASITKQKNLKIK